MPGRASKAATPSALLSIEDVADPATQRALQAMRDAVRELQAQPRAVYLRVDLEIGTNAIPHGLGRAPTFVALTPRVADAGFTWALRSDNPHADRQLLIDVVGVAQPGALLEVL